MCNFRHPEGAALRFPEIPIYRYPPIRTLDVTNKCTKIRTLFELAVLLYTNCWSSVYQEMYGIYILLRGYRRALTTTPTITFRLDITFTQLKLKCGTFEVFAAV
jgi:hypothetical protein